MKTGNMVENFYRMIELMDLLSYMTQLEDYIHLLHVPPACPRRNWIRQRFLTLGYQDQHKGRKCMESEMWGLNENFHTEL